MIRKLKQIFKRRPPIYRIISKETHNKTYYFVQKRVGFSWTYLQDSVNIGYDNHPVDFEAFFETIEGAQAAIDAEIQTDKFNSVKTKIVKLIYSDYLISTQN